VDGSSRARASIFFLLLTAPITVWAVIVMPAYWAEADWPGSLVWAIANAFPLVKKDIGATGEITSAIVAAAILTLLPRNDFNKNVAAAIVALLTYGAYIQMTIFFSNSSGMSLIRANFPTSDQVSEARAAILALISSVRTSSLFIFCSIVGLNIAPLKEAVKSRAKP
jgi:hypothetical protein